MPSSTAAVSYKKRDGRLIVSDDKKYLLFTPSTPTGAPPAVTIPVPDITNLQQTPATSESVALRVVTTDSAKEQKYAFVFTHATAARAEQQAVTDTLRNIITASKAAEAGPARASATPGPTQAAGDAGGKSAAMAIAQAVSGSGKATDSWYDDASLKTDISLQRSLLTENPALAQRFTQSLREKPESVSTAQLTAQFWSSRLHLLRAHAIEKAQKLGEYNVLPEIKVIRTPAEKAGEADSVSFKLTKEQIKLIFKQYPVVMEAYQRESPPLSADTFWTEFFKSKLIKKLKGEKITSQDLPSKVFDKYLDRSDNGPAALGHVPHFIDLEGNEQNHSQRKGNRPDETMRPSSFDKAPILRVLNNLSEKMLSHVAPEDGEAHAPVGMDEDTYDQLRLRDLQIETADNRVVLNIKEQQRYLAGEREDELSAEAKLYAKQDPSKVLSALRSDLQPTNFGSDANGSLHLDKVVGTGSDDSDSEDEAAQQNGATKKKAQRIGSKPAMASATTLLISSIKNRRSASSTDPHSLNGLSQSTFDTLQMTHNTTIEFLHYFWTLFLSGDGSKSSELAQLVSTLEKSLDRINAVAATAEQERLKAVEGLKKEVQAYYQKTGKRRRVDLNVGGGKSVVEAMVRPTVDAIGKASADYRNALEKQTAAVDAAGGV